MRKSLLTATSVFIFIILLISIPLCLTGCDTETTKEKVKTETVEQPEQFILVEKFYIDDTFNEIYCYIFYDRDTKVMYSFIEKNDEGGLSVMYNSDGTPKLYNQ